MDRFCLKFFGECFVMFLISSQIFSSFHFIQVAHEGAMQNPFEKLVLITENIRVVALRNGDGARPALKDVSNRFARRFRVRLV